MFSTSNHDLCCAVVLIIIVVYVVTSVVTVLFVAHPRIAMVIKLHENIGDLVVGVNWGYVWLGEL